MLAPGVVELSGGARVADAVAAAGGATAEAELAAVNLARPVADGEQVYVPRVGESPPAVAGPPPAGAPPAAGQPGAGGDPGAGTGETGAGTGAGGGTGAPAGLVNLNTATAEELDTLPGIGPALAGRILDWRELNGPFTSVADLDEVAGIGPATMARLADLVTV
ncbi:ComEA family DNA-binding protein [Georgenia sp. TF02-10]|uniref:helix-hairpin-helix domain-containing protein n=1 Tax=Georgenia sp. TF02-10 TaxID=2917725 RepID=UPI001FA71090|nr:helix-hairpin-helix domain-containing protein [Georgenia sp. TF02-10]UNX53632.1 ComEA family DNA-binding protein [Georgenia sp. TF02-10]